MQKKKTAIPPRLELQEGTSASSKGPESPSSPSSPASPNSNRMSSRRSSQRSVHSRRRSSNKFPSLRFIEKGKVQALKTVWESLGGKKEDAENEKQQKNAAQGTSNKTKSSSSGSSSGSGSKKKGSAKVNDALTTMEAQPQPKERTATITESNSSSTVTTSAPVPAASPEESTTTAPPPLTTESDMNETSKSRTSTTPTTTTTTSSIDSTDSADSQSDKPLLQQKFQHLQIQVNNENTNNVAVPIKDNGSTTEATASKLTTTTTTTTTAITKTTTTATEATATTTKATSTSYSYSFPSSDVSEDLSANSPTNNSARDDVREMGDAATPSSDPSEPTTLLKNNHDKNSSLCLTTTTTPPPSKSSSVPSSPITNLSDEDLELQKQLQQRFQHLNFDDNGVNHVRNRRDSLQVYLNAQQQEQQQRSAANKLDQHLSSPTNSSSITGCLSPSKSTRTTTTYTSPRLAPSSTPLLERQRMFLRRQERQRCKTILDKDPEALAFWKHMCSNYSKEEDISTISPDLDPEEDKSVGAFFAEHDAGVSFKLSDFVIEIVDYWNEKNEAAFRKAKAAGQSVAPYVRNDGNDDEDSSEEPFVAFDDMSCSLLRSLLEHIQRTMLVDKNQKRLRPLEDDSTASTRGGISKNRVSLMCYARLMAWFGPFNKSMFKITNLIRLGYTWFYGFCHNESEELLTEPVNTFICYLNPVKPGYFTFAIKRSSNHIERYYHIRNNTLGINDCDDEKQQQQSNNNNSSSSGAHSLTSMASSANFVLEGTKKNWYFDSLLELRYEIEVFTGRLKPPTRKSVEASASQLKDSANGETVPAATMRLDPPFSRYRPKLR